MLSKSELKQWTGALRSGKFTQGQGSLKHIKEGYVCHCCLGVLCEIQGLQEELEYSQFVFTDRKGNKNFGLLPEELALKFGSDIGYFVDLKMPNLGCYESIAKANDNGVSFSEIANHLDKYYPAVDDNESGFRKMIQDQVVEWANAFGKRFKAVMDAQNISDTKK